MFAFDSSDLIAINHMDSSGSIEATQGYISHQTRPDIIIRRIRRRPGVGVPLTGHRWRTEEFRKQTKVPNRLFETSMNEYNYGCEMLLTASEI